MLTPRRETAAKPTARFEKLVVTETADEVLLYDTDKHHIHHLNATTAAVWRHCDGQHDTGDLARLAGQALGASVDEATVRLALTKLDDAGLLEQSLADELRMSRMSRRTFMQRAGVVGAIAVPAIVSTTAPAAASHVSGHACFLPCPSAAWCEDLVNPTCDLCVSPTGGGATCEVPGPGICGSCAKNGDCNGYLYDETGQVKCNNCYSWNGTTWDHVGSPLPSATGTCWRNNTVPPFSGNTITLAPAFKAIAVVSVSPAEGAAGDPIQIDVSGFAPGEQISVTWSATGSVLGAIVADDTGAGSLPAVIPLDAAAGPNTIVASSLAGDTSASASINVLAAKVELNPVVTVSPASGEAGTQVTVSVSGFDPAEPVSISFAGGYLTDIANDGSYVVTIPDMAAGSYAFEARQGDAVGSAGFEVLEAKVEVPTTGTASISAVDSATGVQVFNFCVTLAEYGGEGCDSGSGIVTFTEVPVGGYTVVLTSQADGGTAVSTGWVDVPAGETGYGTVSVAFPAPVDLPGNSENSQGNTGNGQAGAGSGGNPTVNKTSTEVPGPAIVEQQATKTATATATSTATVTGTEAATSGTETTDGSTTEGGAGGGG